MAKEASELAANLEQTKTSYREEFGQELTDEALLNILREIVVQKSQRSLVSRYRDWSSGDLMNMCAMLLPKKDEVAAPNLANRKRGRPKKDAESGA